MLAEPAWETLVVVAHGGINNAILSLVLDVREKSGLLNVEQDFGCVNVIDFSGARATLRLLNYTSYDPLKAELKLPAVRILGNLVRARLGPAKDDSRSGEPGEPGVRS
jgi:probable phosphoglycerate mutase